MANAIVSSDLDPAVTDFFQKGTPITIETQDLILRPVRTTDQPFFERLYTNYETMQLYTDNEGRHKEVGHAEWEAQQMKTAGSRVATFVNRWASGDPFTGFVICKKDAAMTPVGFIVVGYGDKAGQSETAFAVIKDEQNKGYGTQAVNAIIQRYIPTLIEVYYKINGKPLEIGDKETGFAPLTEVVATARLDNPSSINRLVNAGMEKVGENTNKWDNIRGIYHIVYENPKV